MKKIFFLIVPLAFLLTDCGAWEESGSSGSDRDRYGEKVEVETETSTTVNTKENVKPQSSQPSPNEVWIVNNRYQPLSNTVPIGSNVTWTNKDAFGHTVTSGKPGTPDGVFDSGSLGKEQSFSYTFSDSGKYSYYCKIHPAEAQGTIVIGE